MRLDKEFYTATHEHYQTSPYKVPSGPTAFFDCDDTLVMWDLPEDMNLNDDRLITVSCRGHNERLLPNEHNIDLLRKFARRGHAIVVWSGGGSDWCEAVVKALGLEEFVHVITGKPNYYIDDQADPRKWIGKHGIFTIDGQKIHGDNIPEIKKEKK